MLAGLMEYQKRQFLQNGGVKELMTKARIAKRGQSSLSTQAPTCPKCGKLS